MSPWFYLLAAGAFEVGFTYFLKQSESFSKLWPSLAFILLGSLSVYLMSKALHIIPLSTAYAVWCGLGIAGTTLTGVILLGESLTLMKAIFLTTLGISIVGLKTMAH
ncbi:DMT family transporter [Pokkaliibacter sp. CJK22405]|uniref:DMT family transporter n=1 Tax=Pokkaliibacter sp. CJK22405 TaxID=3384615 RepID=UPI0039854BA4